MTAEWMSNTDIAGAYGLDSSKSFDAQFSPVSLESIWFGVVATAVWILEKLFDTHKQEVTDIIAGMKPHTKRWYENIGKEFRYGQQLPPDTDKYDNTGLTDDQIEAAKIVKYTAVMDSGAGGLRYKAAKVSNNDLTPLSVDELTAFAGYMERVKDAGVKLFCESNPADLLKLAVTVYYDPLVLSSTGARLDGTAATPVTDAVNKYLLNLHYNGTLVRAYLTDALQAVDGVKVPQITSMQCKYGAGNYTEFSVSYQTDAGYIRLENIDIVYKPEIEHK